MQIKSRGASDGSSMAVWVPFLLLLFTTICLLMGFPGGSDSNDCLQCRRPGFHPWVIHNRTEVSLYTTLEHAKDFYQKVLQNIGGETLAALRTQEFVSLPHPHLLGGGTGSQTGECRDRRVWADGAGEGICGEPGKRRGDRNQFGGRRGAATHWASTARDHSHLPQRS